MIPLPTRPASGDDILTWAREVQRFLEWLRPLSSGTISAEVTPNGTRHNAHILPAKPQSPASEPFDTLYGGKTDTPQAIVLIKRGTLNDEEPTASGDTDSTAQWWRFLMGASDAKYAVLRATLNSSGVVTARQLSLETSPSTTGAGDPSTGAPPPYAYRKLAKIVTDADYGAVVTPYTNRAQQVIMLTSAWACTTAQRVILWTP